jgi:hypothetical protein
MTLKLSKEEAPMGYSIIGWFNTRKEAEAWYNAARKAGKNYPFWMTYQQFLDKKMYHLYWMKAKNTKKCGKGFKGG